MRFYLSGTTVTLKKRHGNQTWTGQVDVVADHFYTALFSAFEQIHCALVAGDSK